MFLSAEGREKLRTIIDDRFRCSHADRALTLQVRANSARFYRLQCLRCGKPKDLKAADLSEPQKQSAVVFDPAIEKAFWHERAEEYARLEQQMLARERKEFVERYHRYLASPEWQKKRDLVLRRDSFLCQGCLHNRATQVHHLHYRRLFREMLFDLTSVCERCHKQVHLTAEELWRQL